MPPGPTEQFAFPELTMTARIASGDARTWARERITGGRLYEILRKHGSSRRGRIRNDQRDVERSGVAALLQARGRGGKSKTTRQRAAGWKIAHWDFTGRIAPSPRRSGWAAHRVQGTRPQRWRPICSDVPWDK